MPDHRLLSRQMRVQWAGWESDTFRLQQAGWSLSADQDIVCNQMRLAMRHEGAQMRAISAAIDYDYYHHAIDGRQFNSMCVPFHTMGRDVMIHEHGRVDWNFKPIDAMPQFTERRISRLDDVVHFAPSLARTNEIILPEDSVPKLLERIRELQEPARVERLKRELNADREGMLLDAQPRQKFHAQIVSIAA